MSAPTALVTGGAGFIGSTLVRRLLAEGFARVVVLDALTYAGRRENLEGVGLERGGGLGGAVELEVGDVCDRDVVRALLGRARPDVVFHLAAESHVDRSIDDSAPFFRTNVDGTRALLDAVREVRRDVGLTTAVIHVSTDEVLGVPPEGAWLDERAGCAPRSPYAASKAAGEHVARAWATTYGLDVVVVRPCNVYGPRQLPEKLVPLATLRASVGSPLPVYGDGLARRDWMHVDDVCDALVRVASARAGSTLPVLHLATGVERTTLDVARAICGALDVLRPMRDGAKHETLIEMVTDRPGHDRRYGIEGTASQRALGWAPKVRFEDGIRDTARWYLDNEAWCADLRHLTERCGLGTPS